MSCKGCEHLEKVVAGNYVGWVCAIKSIEPCKKVNDDTQAR